MKRVRLVAAAAAWLAAVIVVWGQPRMAPSAMRDHPAIAYAKTAPVDPIAALGRRLESGETKLEFTPGSGYLSSLLAALQVPVESQVLVFSKISSRPRASTRVIRARSISRLGTGRLGPGRRAARAHRPRPKAGLDVLYVRQHAGGAASRHAQLRVRGVPYL